MKYEDLWNMHKGSDELHNGFASLYEAHTGENGGDPEDELTPKDLIAVRTIVREFDDGFDDFYNEIMEGTHTKDEKDDRIVAAQEMEETALDCVLTSTHEQLGDAVEARQEVEDDCVRIVLNIPAHHLSAEERVRLEHDVVKEVAEYIQIWEQTKEIRMREPEIREPAEEVEYEQELESAEEGVDMPPDEVLVDIARKWSQTYEQMRVDYDEDFQALENAVVECLIEDGYISPGRHYNVEVVDVSTVGGDKTAFVTGPKGSKIVKKGKKK